MFLSDLWIYTWRGPYKYRFSPRLTTPHGIQPSCCCSCFSLAELYFVLSQKLWQQPKCFITWLLREFWSVHSAICNYIRKCFMFHSLLSPLLTTTATASTSASAFGMSSFNSNKSLEIVPHFCCCSEIALIVEIYSLRVLFHSNYLHNENFRWIWHPLFIIFLTYLHFSIIVIVIV